MSNQMLQTLKGFRDFLPQEKRARDYVAGKIKETFALFGFEPIETPTLEYADLLLGKYGTEADKLVYTFADRGGRQVGLRYDQTVPSARLLSQYQAQLPKFFRRYQIQNVFRADKPQQGRFREFTQCDPDIYGSASPIADAEIIAVTYWVFKNIGFKPQLLINDRQVLFTALEPYATPTISVFSLIQSVDKLDKMSEAAVVAELITKGVEPNQGSAILEAIKTAAPTPALKRIFTLIQALGVPESDYRFNPFTARGLDYYTGMIFEVRVPEYEAGSLGGGGRYDRLIKQLGGPDIPAVGIGLGFDRMVEAALQLNLIPKVTAPATVLIASLQDDTTAYMLSTAQTLRQQQIRTEVFPAIDKPGKILGYANKRQYPFVILIGPDEAANNLVTLKNMQSGDQKTGTLANLVPLLAIP